jgi:hypothetical protein
MLILIPVVLKTHHNYHPLKTLQYPFKTGNFSQVVFKARNTRHYQIEIRSITGIVLPNHFVQ